VCASLRHPYINLFQIEMALPDVSPGKCCASFVAISRSLHHLESWNSPKERKKERKKKKKMGGGGGGGGKA